MNHYILLQDFSKPGIPPHLNGVLAERFDEKDPLPPMAGYSWTKTRDPNRVYPAELWLVTKEEKISFDYMQFWDGYIVSKAFKSILDAHPHPEYKEVKLQVTGWKGNAVTDKEYFFIDIRIPQWIDVVDHTLSVFEWDKDVLKLTGNTEEKIKASGKYFGMIRQFEQLVLKPDIPFDIFRMHTNISDLVCNETFKTHLGSELKTLRYLQLPDLKEYNYRFRKDLLP